MKVSEVFRNIIGIGLEETYVLGDGSLLFFGIKEKIMNIELCVSEETFKYLEESRRIDKSSKDKLGFYNLNKFPHIKVVPKNINDFNCVKVGDLYLEDLNAILEAKKAKNLKKDAKIIEDIENFLTEHPEYRR